MRHWIHVGTQKAASSFLRGLLAQVPEIALASRQELNFFRCAGDHSYDVYLTCFPEKRPILFENSPVYFREGSKCAQAMAETLADKKPMLSLLLRDPVEAIISHHDMRLRQGLFKRDKSYAGDPRDLTNFVRQNPQYINDWRYMTILQLHWLPRFPSESFAIRIFEEFTARPVESVRELAAQIGLDDIGQVQADKVWKNARPSSPLAHRLLLVTSRNTVLRAMRRRAMAIPALRNLAERTLLDNSRASASLDGRMAEAKAELANILQPEVARLCEFLGRDSLPWSNFFNQLSRAPARKSLYQEPGG